MRVLKNYVQGQNEVLKLAGAKTVTAPDSGTGQSDSLMNEITLNIKNLTIFIAL